MTTYLTCGSPYKAMIFPTSWIRPTSWNQSGGNKLNSTWTYWPILRKTLSGVFMKNVSLSKWGIHLWSLSLLISHLYQDALCGSPRRSGTRGRSLGSQRRGRIHQQARPVNWCCPSWSCWSDCSLPTPDAEVRGSCSMWVCQVSRLAKSIADVFNTSVHSQTDLLFDKVQRLVRVHQLICVKHAVVEISALSRHNKWQNCVTLIGDCMDVW